MGIYDRDYSHEHSASAFQRAGRIQMGFGGITPVVKKLLIINIAMFFIQLLLRQSPFPESFFAIDSTSLLTAVQPWRLVSYQFLHGSVMHIFFNMLGLFFLGPTLERHWGGKRFLIFYLFCGAVGGLFYLFLAGIGFLPAGVMVGASGAVLGMLAACAIRFPQFVVFMLLFPVPIRVAAVILTFVYIAAVISKGANAGGDAAHLAGMAAGAGYVLFEPWKVKLRRKYAAQKWEKNLIEHQKLQQQVDRILEKVNQHGIQSLSRKEKKTLEKATKLEQNRNRQL